MPDVPLQQSPVPVADIAATGTADGTTFLRGDGAWEAPAGGGGGGVGPTWTLDANDPLTSLDGVTTNGATWSLDTYLKCVSTSSSWRTVRIDDDVTVRNVPLVAGQRWSVYCEVELDASFDAASDQIRIAMADDGQLGASNSFHGINVTGAGASSLVLGSTSVTGSTVSVSPGWHSAQVVSVGDKVYGLWDGAVVATAGEFGLSGDVYRPFVWVYGATTVRIRNMRGWSGQFSMASLGSFPTS